MPAEGCRELEPLAEWSDWVPIGEAPAVAPRTAGVYVARQGQDGPVVYVGMAGDRNGKGLRGRLKVYLSGKALVSGLGEAVFDRALADPIWLRERLREVEAGKPLRAKNWGKIALTQADLYVRWTTTADRKSALALELACLQALCRHRLWNRLRPIATDDAATIRAALSAVTAQQWAELDATVNDLLQAQGPICRWESQKPTVEMIEGVEREVFELSYPQYADEINVVVHQLYEMGLIVPIDWMSWSAAQPDLHEVPIVDSVTAVTYLTAVIRNERFDDGSIECAHKSGRLVEALQVLIQWSQLELPHTDLPPVQLPVSGAESFEPDLLRKITRVLSEGDIVTTLSHGRPNVIGRIDESGLEVTTERSEKHHSGKLRFIPAWMFNLVWQELQNHGRVERDAVAHRATRKVKRASAVFAVLERLPEVSVAEDSPLALELNGQSDQRR